MEKLMYLDTHVVVWLYAGDLTSFPAEVISIIGNRSVIISPMVLLELQYLYEVHRIKVGADRILKSLEKSIGLKICQKDFDKVIRESLKQSWTRDPFDRMIVAQASLGKSSLITKDETIKKHYLHTIWR